MPSFRLYRSLRIGHHYNSLIRQRCYSGTTNSLWTIRNRPWNHAGLPLQNMITPSSPSYFKEEACVRARGRRPCTLSTTSAASAPSSSSQQQQQKEEEEEQENTTAESAQATTTAAAATSESKSSKENISIANSETSNDNSSSNQKKTPTSKNSYLVVKLEQKVVKNISDEVQSIKTKFLTSVELPRQAVEKHYGTTNYINQDNQPTEIQLRQHDSLELILFSGGVALNTVPPDVLQKFYDQVVHRLDRAGMALTTAKKLNDGNIAHPDDYWFLAHEVKLFPPTKKHLLVVTFQTSIAWMCVYEDIQLIANQFPELPQRPLEKNQILRWLPLIVVADVTGGTGRFIKEKTILQNIVTDWPLDCTSIQQTISMGGTIPTQVVPTLSWNFQDTLRKRPENEDEIMANLEKDEFWKVPLKQTPHE